MCSEWESVWPRTSVLTVLKQFHYQSPLFCGMFLIIEVSYKIKKQPKTILNLVFHFKRDNIFKSLKTVGQKTLLLRPGDRNAISLLLNKSIKSDLHPGLEAGRTNVLQGGLSMPIEEPSGLFSTSRDLMCMPCNPWTLPSVFNYSLSVELIALLHRLNKPPWVFFPGWGQLPLLSITEQPWCVNGVWRKGSVSSGRGDLQAGRAAGKAACKAETEMENPGASVSFKSFISSAVSQSCFLWPFRI